MPSIDIFKEMSEHVSLRIHSCQDRQYDMNWLESKSHKYYDIWLIQEGRISIRTGSALHTADPGDIVLFYPHSPYTAYCEHGTCKFIYVHFDFGMGNRLRILDDFALSGIVSGELAEQETALFIGAYEDWRNQSAMAGIRMKACLMLLLSQVVECYGQGRYLGAFHDESSQSGRPQNLFTLQPVFQYIQEHLHRPIRIGDIAAIAGLSEKYFIAYFKKTLGITPGQYITQLKMNRAREYLYQHKYSIKEISFMLGFPDTYTFSKAFKRTFHVPPTQFL